MIRLMAQVERGDFRLDVDLSLPIRGVTALYGPSGSGKTSLLRVLAGLERAEKALVSIGDSVWQDSLQGVFVPTHRRALGYVFQEASLFDHLSVQDNLEFGRRRVPKGKIVASELSDPSKVIDLLGIRPLLGRRPQLLSGGERQRVAIARAVLAAPQLLLMDEPLAALDAARKREILPYLERLRDELSIPMVYVSHAGDEVARLADHLVLLEAGNVVGCGTLADTLARVDLPGVFADEAAVVVPARLVAHEDDHLSRLEFSGGCLYVAARSESPGQILRCQIQARDVSLALEKPQGTSILNLFPGKITAIEPAPTQGHVMVQVLAGQVFLLARITLRSAQTMKLEVGQRLWAQVKAVALL